MVQSPNGSGVRRRAVLGTLASGAAASLGGCLRRARSVAGWESMTHVSLRIKTLPADSDPYALSAGRTIAAWFQRAGIDAQVVPVSEEELLRQVLVSNDFDVFLGRMDTQRRDPDALYGLLHSKFADARGWQNPFGFADFDVDELLERQRRISGDQRREAVAELQRSIARSQPFTLLAFPDEIRAARSDQFRNWRGVDLQSPYGYLSLDRIDRDGSDERASTDPDGGEAVEIDGEDAGDESVLRIVVTDSRATENLNPLSVEYRRSGVIMGLLYDSIGTVTSQGTTTWMAESWTFADDGGGPQATVRLRPGLRWHDGTSVTAEDIAFTYALFADTSLGSTEREGGETEQDARVPAPRFQGRAGLVDDVRATDAETAVFRFADCDPRVATRAFTVPILPKHVWENRTNPVSISGIEVGRATEALVTNNIPPVGSGPLRFAENAPRESLVLEPFEDHFIAGGDADEPVSVPVPDFDRLALQVVGSDNAAVGVVAAGDADATGTPVGAASVPRIGRSEDLELLVNRSDAPYIVGYNAQSPPLTNPRFRHTLARLIDQTHVVSRVFDGYARPAASPLGRSAWVPEDLQWDKENGNPVTPFFGDDGEVDVDQARAAFRDAGFQYNGGRLMRGA
ncbi:ABC transporter substrate-binding protein [Halobellus sp. GM3]|uniref:ABC transporter substrate-binding protein n=1 Tax=Halobellus sp. GM3 TaxID=3458410 RepID=UPI00403E075C